MAKWDIPQVKGAWTVIDYQDKRNVNKENPTLGKWDGKHFFWSGGQSHRTFDELPPVLKEYPLPEGIDTYDWDSHVLTQFCKDFPMIPNWIAGEPGETPEWYLLESATGWVSPEGHLWLCSYGSHIGLIGYLGKQLWGESNMWDATKRFNDEHWASVQNGRVSVSGSFDAHISYEQFLSLIALKDTIIEQDKKETRPMYGKAISQLEETIGYLGWPKLGPETAEEAAKWIVHPPTRRRISKRDRGDGTD